MRLWLKHLLRTLSTYLTWSTNHGAVRRKIYLHYSFTTSMQSSAPILRLTSDKNWFGTMSHRKMHRRSGRSYPMMQKSLRLPNSMQPIYYSTLIRPKWRTGKALCFHSSSITKSRFGYTTSYNPLTSRPPTMRRWSISKMQSMRSRSWDWYRLLAVN
jgi:hypothetical protein